MKSSGEIKLFAVITVVAVVLVGLVLWVSGSGSTDSKIKGPTPVQLTRDMLVPSWSHRRGKPDAPFTLVEFGDYQCPTCRRAKTEVAKLLDQNKDRLNYVYHHFQASPAHTNSLALAVAAEAADQQGRFWEMYERLYDDQDKFNNASPEAVLTELKRIAFALKLDMLKFSATIARESATGKAAVTQVEKQGKIADTAGAIGTPAFYFIQSDGKVMQLNTLEQLQTWLKDPKHWKS